MSRQEIERNVLELRRLQQRLEGQSEALKKEIAKIEGKIELYLEQIREMDFNVRLENELAKAKKPEPAPDVPPSPIKNEEKGGEKE